MKKVTITLPDDLARWLRVRVVEFATLQWVHWDNHRRLFGPLGHVPPAAFEAHDSLPLRESAMAA